jgi:hypothetical protein
MTGGLVAGRIIPCRNLRTPSTADFDFPEAIHRTSWKVELSEVRLQYPGCPRLSRCGDVAVFSVRRAGAAQ